MTMYERVINLLMDEGKLKEYDTISLGCVGFHLKYGTNIVRHNEAPTLTTKGDVAVVLYE